jgi:hypothetical protein
MLASGLFQCGCKHLAQGCSWRAGREWQQQDQRDVRRGTKIERRHQRLILKASTVQLRLCRPSRAGCRRPRRRGAQMAGNHRQRICASSSDAAPARRRSWRFRNDRRNAAERSMVGWERTATRARAATYKTRRHGTRKIERHLHPRSRLEGAKLHIVAFLEPNGIVFNVHRLQCSSSCNCF